MTKLDPTGSDLIYSTYLGGNAGDLAASDIAAGIALDALGNAYVAGWTFSRDFPVTPGAFQSSMGGIVDAFVAKITDLAVPAPPPVTVGKVTGGGSIHLGNDVGTFGFAVQRKPQDGPITGNLQYIDHATGARVRAVTFTSLAITGNIASFEGTCTRNRIPCTFAVTVTDHGEPALYPTSRGSRASRSPSPTRSKLSTTSVMAMPGATVPTGVVRTSSRLRLSIAPHSGSGGWTPRPRNASEAPRRPWPGWPARDPVP